MPSKREGRRTTRVIHKERRDSLDLRFILSFLLTSEPSLSRPVQDDKEPQNGGREKDRTERIHWQHKKNHFQQKFWSRTREKRLTWKLEPYPACLCRPGCSCSFLLFCCRAIIHPVTLSSIPAKLWLWALFAILMWFDIESKLIQLKGKREMEEVERHILFPSCRFFRLVSFLLVISLPHCHTGRRSTYEYLLSTSLSCCVVGDMIYYFSNRQKEGFFRESIFHHI